MKLQLDPNQNFQLDAVAAVVDLFDGQPQGPPEHSVIDLGAAAEGLFAGQDRTELGLGNQLKANAVQIFKTKGVTSFKTV